MINYRNIIILEDLQALYKSTVKWQQLQNKTILVTGATGMLASYFCFMLLYLNEKHNFGIQLYLLARSRKKLEKVFGKENHEIKFVVQDVCEKINIDEKIDFIFHAAGSASPYFIINDPTGIIKANTLGTIRVLAFARKSSSKKVLFTSSREIYGKVEIKEEINESDMGIIDPLDSRSCYPESKRIAETLLKSYSLQFNVNFNTLRIAHTYGPGMQVENDGRVMSDFLNDAIHNRDIQLNSTGNAERAFCYITDAIEAIFRILTDGENNSAFNIANETESIQIKDLARLIQQLAGNQKTVIIPPNETNKQGYTNYARVKMDTTKVRALGWQPKVSLKNGIIKTLNSFK